MNLYDINIQERHNEDGVLTITAEVRRYSVDLEVAPHSASLDLYTVEPYDDHLHSASIAINLEGMKAVIAGLGPKEGPIEVQRIIAYHREDVLIQVLRSLAAQPQETKS